MTPRTAEQPLKIAIVGLGLIGGSMALDLRKSGYASRVLGVDSYPEHAKMALKLGLVDSIHELSEALVLVDLVILAAPVSVVGKLLPTVLDQIKDQTTVTDVGSTKAAICKLVQNHPRRHQFVPSHPMAGTEHSGPAAAIENLFRNKAAVICDRAVSGEEHVARVEELYSALKMRLIYMNSAEHDLHAAYVSHLSHITSFVLASTVLDKEKDVDAIFNLASGGFESTVRLAKSSPEMWTPIFEQNRENVVEALSAYIDRLQAFRETLLTANFDQTKQLMQQANEIKRVLAQLGGSRG